MHKPIDPTAPHAGSFEKIFRERLAPGPGLYIALLLLIPAVMLTVTPLNSDWALPVAIGLYVIIAGSLFAFAPTIEVSDGHLSAGSARIPVTALGDAEALNRDSLRAALGPGLDARTFLLVRGYIHTGVRVALEDPSDPTPQWILTTRRPGDLLTALRAAQSH
ncbi:DUF3093 domain-containing protein [Leucobacter sp. W1153]|uniref:DUF3093 domain-containing protein n=1 Tax=unclassified Leucobacter TaxID=2621730 RepID=UPI003F33C433